MENNTQTLLLFLAVAMLPTNHAIAAFTPVVNAGQTVDGEIIDGGDAAQQTVEGEANNTTILTGSQFIFGTANNTILKDGVHYIVYDGVSNGILMSGGELAVNGIANDVVSTAGLISINSGLNGTVDSALGGSMNRTVLSGSAFLENRFGIDTDTIVNAGAELQTGSGLDNDWIDTAISNNATVNEGGLQTVDNQGTSNGSTINKGGTIKILYFMHNKTDTDNSGPQYGTANDTVVYGEMQNNGGVDNNSHIMPDATFSMMGSIKDGMAAISENATLENGVKATINENAQANGWTVNGGIEGSVTLEDETSAINDSTFNSGALLINKGTAVNILMNDGQMNNVGGSDVDSVISNGIYTLGGTETASSTNLIVGNGAVANIESGTLTDSTINGTMNVQNNPERTDMISTLMGTIAVNEGAQLNLSGDVNTVDASLVLSGTGNLHLAESTTVNSPYHYSLGTVTMSGSSIYFDSAVSDISSTRYSTLTMQTLDGTGSFYMNSNLASLTGNFLTIQGEANGDFDVYIADTGVSPVSASALKIIQTGGGDADFTLANNGNVVDVGTYQYFLVADGTGDWALSPNAQQPVTPVEPAATDPVTPAEPAADVPVTPEDATAAEPATPAADVPVTPEDATVAEPATPAAEPVTPAESAAEEPVPAATPSVPSAAPMISPSTRAVLSMAAVDPLIFRTELNTVRSRMDQTRSYSHDLNVWGHYTTSQLKLNNSAGANFELDINGLTIGADNTQAFADGILSEGVFFSYSHSKVDFHHSGSGKTNSYSVGAYTSYRDSTGLYLDGILKINRFKNDVNARMTSGMAANGSYDVTGLGINLEAGKYLYIGNAYVVPYTSVMGFTGTSQHYTLSNGMKAHVGNQQSVIGEAGVRLGHDVIVNNTQVQPYLKLAIEREFIDDNEVGVNNDKFVNDLSGARGIYQVGVNVKLTERLAVHTDVSYSRGNRLESPWNANLGVSWSF